MSAAADSLHPLQFKYDTPDLGGSTPIHDLRASDPSGKQVGMMQWTKRGIQSLHVAPEVQRQGVATAMWQEGHRLAEETRRIPQPQHSSDRTTAGDAWARSVGGRLPRRSQWSQ